MASAEHVTSSVVHTNDAHPTMTTKTLKFVQWVETSHAGYKQKWTKIGDIRMPRHINRIKQIHKVTNFSHVVGIHSPDSAINKYFTINIPAPKIVCVCHVLSSLLLDLRSLMPASSQKMYSYLISSSHDQIMYSYVISSSQDYKHTHRYC